MIIKRTPEPEPPLRFVDLDKRKPHWPRVNADVASTTTRYEVRGIKCVGMMTDVDGLSVGWDLCGTCKMYFSRCKCPGGLAAPPGIVYIYRQRKGITYPSDTLRGPYIGLRHDPDGSVAPLVIDSPTARLAAATDEPEDIPEPVKPRTTGRVLKRRRPKQ